MCDFWGIFMKGTHRIKKLIHKNQSNKKEIDALVLQHFSMRLSSMNHLLVHVLDLLLICSYCDFFLCIHKFLKDCVDFWRKKLPVYVTY